jgi:pyruvate kinase
MATIGPASQSDATLREMIDAGVTAARFDVSIGTLDGHLRSLEAFQRESIRANRLCAFCLDVAGRSCEVVQPFLYDDEGWPEFLQQINIYSGQIVHLTLDGDLHVPTVRRL